MKMPHVVKKNVILYNLFCDSRRIKHIVQKNEKERKKCTRKYKKIQKIGCTVWF